MTCPKCQSKQIIPDARVLDRGDHNSVHNLALGVDQKPDALIFKGTQKSTVRAQVCADCGFVELYAADPKVLWGAMLNQRASAE